MKRLVIVSILACTSACGSQDSPRTRQGSGSSIDDGGPDTAQRSGSVNLPDTSFAASFLVLHPPTPQDTISAGSQRPPLIVLTRRADLTGDSIPERFHVAASGTRLDSMRVALEVTDERGQVLYQDDWSTDSYFKYEPEAQESDTSIARVVYGHLNDLLADRSFLRPVTEQEAAGLNPQGIEAETVAFDLAERGYRDARGLDPYEPLTSEQLRDVLSLPVDSARVRALVEELRRARLFDYYGGGEAVYTIAWSPALQRLVRVFACC